MGEILGISNLTGGVVSLQTKPLVPHTLARQLFQSLVKSISSKNPQQIIENFRAQYLTINEVILFVFSTLTENPFLSLDSLNKLKEFLLMMTKDLRCEVVLKRPMEVNFAMEDILHGMDPSGRLLKTPLFLLSKPLSAASESKLLYMNKTWKEEGTVQTSALLKAKKQLEVENHLKGLKVALPEAKPQGHPQVHPFALQFIDSVPVVQPKPKPIIVRRIAENSVISLAKPLKKPSEDFCKLVIMVKKKLGKILCGFPKHNCYKLTSNWTNWLRSYYAH